MIVVETTGFFFSTIIVHEVIPCKFSTCTQSQSCIIHGGDDDNKYREGAQKGKQVLPTFYSEMNPIIVVCVLSHGRSTMEPFYSRAPQITSAVRHFLQYWDWSTSCSHLLLCLCAVSMHGIDTIKF